MKNADATPIEISVEPILEPDLPIVDSHHHLFFRPPPGIFPPAEGLPPGPWRDFVAAETVHRYLLDEFLADANTGHNIRASVYMPSGSMCRASGPEAMKAVGEIEFANGVAAMAASKTFGDVQVCAGIVGYTDLQSGDAVQAALEAQVHAGGARFRGVRYAPMYDPDPDLIPWRVAPHLLRDPMVRKGISCLTPLGLSLDVLLLEPQLPDLIEVARDLPEAQFILNHMGFPVGAGSYTGKREERFPIWRDNIRTLAACGNVVVKLGGLGLPYAGFKTYMSKPPASSERIAADWKPYVEVCIEAFGVERCMFESNFHDDAATCAYPILWNAFKRIVAGASPEEKKALFFDTAKRVYRLDISDGKP